MEQLAYGSPYEAFKNAAKKYSGKPALIFLGEKYTYSQLKDLVERFAVGLYGLDIRKGDKVIIYLTNTPQWVIAWLALQRIGAVAVPITPVYTPHDLIYIASDSRAESILCLDTNFGYVSQALPKTGLKKIIVTNVVELIPWWKRTVVRIFDRAPKGKFKLGRNIFTFKSLLKTNVSSLPPLKFENEETAVLLYTGGTTGFPKGVPISKINLVENASGQRSPSVPLIPLGEDIVMQGAPLYHIFGHVQGLGALFQGDTLILLPRFNLDGMLDHIERYGATTLFGVPAMYRMILEHDRLDQYELDSLRYSISAGDMLPLEVADKWQREFGKPLYQGYGTTETCGAVSLTTAGQPFPKGAAGQIVPFQKVKLVDPDSLYPVPPGKPGELLVSSEHMVTSYWNKPEESADCFINLDGRLWYRTRDIVSVDSDGWFFFLDRSGDIIKHKGYRVAASKIETVLQEHPTVIGSCVVGVPDQKVGERIKAFVVLKEDVRGVTAYDLMKWCRDKLAPYEVPQYIEFRDMLPKSKVGKLLRREMRAEERRKLGKS
jgi:long-chain acyl-CoA synthetase